MHVPARTLRLETHAHASTASSAIHIYPPAISECLRDVRHKSPRLTLSVAHVLWALGGFYTKDLCMGTLCLVQLFLATWARLLYLARYVHVGLIHTVHQNGVARSLERLIHEVRKVRPSHILSHGLTTGTLVPTSRLSLDQGREVCHYRPSKLMHASCWYCTWLACYAAKCPLWQCIIAASKNEGPTVSCDTYTTIIFSHFWWGSR